MTTKKTKAPAKKAAARKTKPKAAPAAAAETPEEREEREYRERLAKRRERWAAWSASPDALDELCEFIVNNGIHGHLAAFSRLHDFPYATLMLWLDSDPNRIKAYNKARLVRADALADEVVQIANEPVERTLQGNMDGTHVQDKRLRIDTVKWVAGKLNPKRYGDKLALGGADDLPPVQSQVSGELKLSPSEAYRKLIGG